MLYDNTNSGTPKLTQIPTLETERLVLRGHRLADQAARGAISSDPRIMAFIGGVHDAAENLNRIYRYVGMWELCGRGPFAVEEKATGRFMGEIGIGDLERGMGEGFDGEPEAMWMLAAAGQGKGYAEEAMRAVIGWHDQAFGRQRLVAIIAPDHLRSLRLAERLGFTMFDSRAFYGKPVLLLERLA
jgi:RimJ/RimL family protein N-acetyltransferase